MTAYAYYPGCSLSGLGKPYDESLRAVFGHLGLGLEEIPDWNCCGATSYMSVSEDKAVALAARNLALAEQMRRGGRGAVRRVLPGADQGAAHDGRLPRAGREGAQGPAGGGPHV